MLSPSRLASRASPRRAAAALLSGRQHFHSEVGKAELIRTQGFINGKWVDAKEDARYSVVGTSPSWMLLVISRCRG